MVALLLALLTQALIIGLFLFFSQYGAPPTPTKPQAVMLRGLSSEAFAKNRGVAPPDPHAPITRTAKRTDKPPPEKKPEELPKGQVVATPQGNNQVDEKAQYLAESNNTTKKETRAKETTAFYKNAMARQTSTHKSEADSTGNDQVEKATVAGNNGQGADDRPQSQQSQPKLAFNVPDVKASSELKLKQDNGVGVTLANRHETEALLGNSDRLNVQLGQAGSADEGSQGRIGRAGAVNLLPSAAIVDRLSGAAANDNLKDVDEGDGTYLNTREWKYAGFFNRVKQSVGQHWAPAAQLRLRDPTQQLYGGKDRYTVLTVTLDAQGKLKETFVQTSSGLDFLDAEAMKAFERAQPFPNPPPGLLASDQTVRFQFGFMLELGGNGGMRLFRYAD